MRFLIIFLTVLTAYSCRETFEYTIDSNRLSTAKMNLVDWKAESFIFIEPNKHDTSSIIINVYNQEAVLREKLLFYNIPLNEGRYYLRTINVLNRNMVTGAGYQTILADGDVLGEQYYVLEDTSDNWIEIDHKSIESNKIVLKGKFQVALGIDPQKGKKFDLSPDWIRFTEGVFVTREN